MRAAIRLLVTVGLVCGAGSLAPLASATTGPAPQPTATSTADPTGSGDGTPTGTPSTPPPSTTPPGSTPPVSTAPAPSDPATPSGTASTSPTESPSTGTEPSAPAGAGAAARKRDARPTVTFTHRPSNLVLGKVAGWSYRSDVPDVRFECRMTTGSKTAPFGDCPTADDHQTGSKTYRHLKGNAAVYHFAVRAVRTSPGSTPGRAVSDPFRRFTVSSPGTFVPHTGASFNHVMGRQSSQRTNLTRIIKTVNGMPGYREATPSTCPTSASVLPGTIRVSLYSLTDQAVAKALVAASRRCVSVQVLMNDHLNSKNDGAWSRLAGALGSSVYHADGRVRRSFAHRCHHACRGGGVLHSKMYLFNSTVPAPQDAQNRIRRTVITGSSNMTANAAKVQWNDLYAVANRRGLFNEFTHEFGLMRKDNGFHRNPSSAPTDGPYRVSFAPGPRGYDPYVSLLRSVHCSGATGGSGIHGHTVIYINMHAWFGTRGAALANRVRHLYNQGCYVRVLYSFMAYKSVYKKLVTHTNGRMVVRRTIFSSNGRTATLYSHFKNIAISGHVGSHTARRMAVTGSNNWTNEGINFDEVVLRISTTSAYRSYRNQWIYIRNHKSSPVYANYSEPTGGGRAP